MVHMAGEAISQPLDAKWERIEKLFNRMMETAPYDRLMQILHNRETSDALPKEHTTTKYPDGTELPLGPPRSEKQHAPTQLQKTSTVINNMPATKPLLQEYPALVKQQKYNSKHRVEQDAQKIVCLDSPLLNVFLPIPTGTKDQRGSQRPLEQDTAGTSLKGTYNQPLLLTESVRSHMEPQLHLPLWPPGKRQKGILKGINSSTRDGESALYIDNG